MGDFATEAVFLEDQGGEKTYRLEVENDFMSLIPRKNKNGRIYRDGRNLLNQQVHKKEAEDLLIDTPLLNGGDNLSEE